MKKYSLVGLRSQDDEAKSSSGKAHKLVLLALFIFCIVCGQANTATAQIYNITTVAGTGSAGSTGDGGAALSADVQTFYGVATGPGAGDFYITSAGFSVVRWVTGGTIDVFAGTLSSAGFSGDGGAATAAQLNSPIGIAQDGGNVYIADMGNHCVRIVDVSGTITTIAGIGMSSGYTGDGAAATLAKLSQPVAIAVDAGGHIFIADMGNNVVRKVDLLGVITTYAGTGTPGYTGDGSAATLATLSQPTGLACDNAGNLYIADRGNNVIRMVDAVSGNITTYAGTGTFSFTGDIGPATAATFDGLWGIATDAADNLYIADISNNRIRKVDAVSGTIRSIAGNGFSGFAGDGGPALAARLNAPRCVALDGTDLYITDFLNNRVRKCDEISATLIPSSLAELTSRNTGEPFNTAMIHYAPRKDSAIFGAVFCGAQQIFVYDIGTGNSVTYPDTNGSVPDVIIGNHPTNPRDYIMAVITNSHVGNNVEVTFYDITGVGTGGLAIAYKSRSISPSYGSYITNRYTTHIDVLAESATYPTLPTCNKFMVAFDANTGGGGGGGSEVHFTMGDLSATPPSVNWPGLITTTGSEPDISAIQWSGPDDVALVSYVDGSQVKLGEYNFTSPSWSSCVLDNSNMIFHQPRIDAEDDYTINTSSAKANYKVAVCAGYLPAWVGDYEVRTYDNLMGCTDHDYFASASYLDMNSYGFVAPYSHSSPAVALANPNQYAVFHWSNPISAWRHNPYWVSYDSVSDSAFAIMEGIDANANHTLSPNAYYVVDSIGVTPVKSGIVWYPNNNWRISISSSANFHLWDTIPIVLGYGYQHNGWGGNHVTDFKITASGGSFAFKHGADPTSEPIGGDIVWQVYPNPASNVVTIKNGTGANEATGYSVTDMVGRVLKRGPMIGTLTKIDVSGFADGSYLIELHNGVHKCGHAKFVKN